jgi:hypothetical protein
MKRLIATFGVAAALALTAAANAGGSQVFAKESELRHGADNPPENEIELVGRENELRDGKDDGPDDRIQLPVLGPEDVTLAREGERRHGDDDGADDQGVDG